MIISFKFLGTQISGGGGGDTQKSYLSLERLRPYLYAVSFDAVEEMKTIDSYPVGSCTTYVDGGKTYRNYDFKYDNTAEFLVRTKDFTGMAAMIGMNDGDIDPKKVGQIPYYTVDGVNQHGITVTAHILFNDWGWSGSGAKTNPITALPYMILTAVTSMDTIADDLAGILADTDNNIYESGYAMQFCVSDGTTTYAIVPPDEDGQQMVLTDITSNPKLTNFRWVSDAVVVRTDDDLQTRPTGVERWNMAPADLNDLRFTVAYEDDDRLSEFIGIDGTTKDSTDEELAAIWAEAQSEYESRDRETGTTWQTVHSVVYSTKMEHLYIQENYDDDIICSAPELPEGIMIEPDGGETGYVLTKTAVGYEWDAAGSGSSIVDITDSTPYPGSATQIYKYYDKLYTYNTSAGEYITIIENFKYKASQISHSKLIGVYAAIGNPTLIAKLTCSNSSIQSGTPTLYMYYIPGDDCLKTFTTQDTQGEPVDTIEHDGIQVNVSITNPNNTTNYLKVAFYDDTIAFEMRCSWSPNWLIHNDTVFYNQSSDGHYELLYKDTYVDTYGSNSQGDEALFKLVLDDSNNILRADTVSFKIFHINGGPEFKYIGEHNSSSFPNNLYSPTTVGQLNQILVSNGTGAPVWTSEKIVFCTGDEYDSLDTHDATTLYIITD